MALAVRLLFAALLLFAQAAGAAHDIHHAWDHGGDTHRHASHDDDAGPSTLCDFHGLLAEVLGAAVPGKVVLAPVRPAVERSVDAAVPSHSPLLLVPDSRGPPAARPPV